jgi:hypothetical protein
MFLCSVQYDFCGELDAARTTTFREIEKYIEGVERLRVSANCIEPIGSVVSQCCCLSTE